MKSTDVTIPTLVGQLTDPQKSPQISALTALPNGSQGRYELQHDSFTPVSQQ